MPIWTMVAAPLFTAIVLGLLAGHGGAFVRSRNGRLLVGALGCASVLVSFIAAIVRPFSSNR